jgi:hypothetical protein
MVNHALSEKRQKTRLQGAAMTQSTFSRLQEPMNDHTDDAALCGATDRKLAKYPWLPLTRLRSRLVSGVLFFERPAYRELSMSSVPNGRDSRRPDTPRNGL